MNHTTVKPRTTRREDYDLRTTVSRVYGYAPECGCGWKGHTWTSVYHARLEASFHRCAQVAA